VEKIIVKIAILISGEYRTFGLCRKTMTFLNDPNIDIYFSTWNKTIYNVPKLGLYVEEEVTTDRINKDLGRSSTIEIEPHNLLIEKRYNSKLIHRWKRGIELIKNSGIEYDYVLVVRPDLYFNDRMNPTFDFIEKYKDTLASAWYHEPDRGFLNDVMFLSSYKKIIELFDNLIIGEWEISENSDWHTWWYDFSIKYFSIIHDFTEMAHCTFCRYYASPTNTFTEIAKIQDDWSNILRLQLAERVGKKFVEEKWPKGWPMIAEEKWNSGNYEKYVIPKIAIVISGMLRNYDTALLSLDIFGNYDRYLITWESAGISAIEDYSERACIKESFIISDEKFEEVYREPYKNGNHTFRMVYLWNQISKNIPKNYDKYLIIRPDGFYWTKSRKDVLECIKSEGPFKTSQKRQPWTNGIDDHLFVIDKSHINKLDNCYNDLICAAASMIEDGTATNKYGHYLNPHELLYRMWNQNIDKEDMGTDLDLCSEKLYLLIEPLWVRHTFKKSDKDIYNEELYKAVFYDTAATWRNITGSNYHGIFNRLK
jgi:hypothetical protein